MGRNAQWDEAVRKLTCYRLHSIKKISRDFRAVGLVYHNKRGGAYPETNPARPVVLSQIEDG